MPLGNVRAMSRPASVLFLCTGNAARSVMGAVALAQLRPDLHITSAGTLTVDGLPISWRTKAALDDVGLPTPSHRSRQATASDLAAADLIVAMAPEHVAWVRREHPAVAGRTATIKHLTAVLPPEPADLGTRVDALGLADHLPTQDEEVADPGGGEVDVFIACAREVADLVADLAKLL